MLLAKQKAYDKCFSVPQCPLCNKPIGKHEVGMCEMIRTRRKTTIFVHKLCLEEKKNEAAH